MQRELLVQVIVELFSNTFCLTRYAPDVSLGSLISQYQDSFTTRPWLFWWPGLFIITIALSINFIGDGLRDAFDPRQRRRLTKKDKEQAKVQAKIAAQSE
jgi:peptide/nickel transport system permease protein